MILTKCPVWLDHYMFIGELLKLSWVEGGCSIEIAKPEVDSQGYDLITEEKGVIRHIQLKAAHLGAKVAKQKIHVALASKPAGCVVWVYFNEQTMELRPFLFFGGVANQPLPSINGFRIAKHTKANADGITA